MKSLKIKFVIFGSLGLFFLGACNNGNQVASPDSSPAAVNNSADATPQGDTTHAAVPQAGGQVIESGPYHLEFVHAAEPNGIHLDFYLQRGDNHEPIPDANVTAQVQLPDGTPKTLNMEYDAAGKHYTATLPGQASGEYRIAILSEVNGEKVNGRFAFNR
ncbi:hypothetical protein [Gloeocapsopsis dulcis]|uniref:YtkA-like domain-containing protein n=1 Tax=Gloeocapsopsis dulcis AAB1 = 1H9 TaxID=1433147 RepID=A0A6N8FW82_9CHRO|nr:hypothetical protein [Gloeocapsopsis dulcis]MUL37024.1 hypothetical protein [Gloeocapsopsis dulcis AAB1 = 1H9]WNN87877.1 hypothetical protein P0S91_16370 [Gloeocapsopsis dulcis]